MFVNPLAPSNPYNPFNSHVPIKQSLPHDKDIKPKPPGDNIPRYLNFLADYTGCGHWRMLWPEQVLNSYRQCAIQSSTVMITDLKHFNDVECIRVQRQASPAQQKYLEFLRSNTNARLIYEIDDICFSEDIPDYNPFKSAFTSPETRASIQYMMEFCDEMTVTCPAMREYFLDKTKQTNITVIPNYPTRSWLGRFYDRKRISSIYDKSIKKPRILYAGSSSHFDIHRKNDNKDDMSHVIDGVLSTINKYQWVFLGGYPAALENLVQQGKVEFHKWAHLCDYPDIVYNLKINAMIAPLADNIFNRCKSNIKFLEASGLGIPIICQDIGTYDICPNKFTTNTQMLDEINKLFNNKKYYMNICESNYNKLCNLWLENIDNRTKYLELYKYSYGSPERVNINNINDN